jgi:hypothetical protein
MSLIYTWLEKVETYIGEGLDTPYNLYMKIDSWINEKIEEEYGVEYRENEEAVAKLQFMIENIVSNKKEKTMTVFGVVLDMQENWYEKASNNSYYRYKILNPEILGEMGREIFLEDTYRLEGNWDWNCEDYSHCSVVERKLISKIGFVSVNE